MVKKKKKRHSKPATRKRRLRAKRKLKARK
jgi:hypothetical protein